MCQSIQQQTPDGESCVGGEPLHQKGRETKKKLWETQAEPVSLLCDTDAVTHGAQDVTHRCEWRAWLVPLPPHVSHSHLQPHFFYIELPQMIPKQFHVAGWQAVPFVLNMCETMGKACACFMPPLRRKNAYPFAVHVRFGISRSSLCEHFQAWEACKSGEDAFYKADTRTLRQESVPIQNKSSSCASFKGATEKRDFAAFSILQKLFLQTLVSLSIELVSCRAAPCYIPYYAVNSQDFLNILKSPRPHTYTHTHTLTATSTQLPTVFTKRQEKQLI